jgi:putative lipoprotein
MTHRRNSALGLLPAALLLIAAQAHSAPAEPLDRISGSVTYRERIALPEDVTLAVELLDVSKQDAKAERLAQLTLPVGSQQVPLAFELPFYPAAVQPAHRYTLRATLSSGGELLFTTAQQVPVLTHGAGKQAQLVLQQVQQKSSAALENTYWKLIEVDGRPAQTLPGEREAHLLLLDGHASGSSGCNKLMGSYTHAAPNSLHIGPLASTRMACPPGMMAQETALVTAFERATRYRIAGDTLSLLDGDTVLARYEARYFK